MTPAQRAFFLAALHERNRYRSSPLDRSRWTAGSLSLKIARHNDVRVRADLAAPRPGGTPPRPPGGDAVVAGQAASATAAAPASRTLTGIAVTQIGFQLHFGGDQPEVFSFRSAAL
jgi:hypothetical protein